MLICSCQKNEQNKTIETPSILNEQNNLIEIPVLPEENITHSEKSYHTNEGLEDNYQAAEYDWTNDIKEFETINGTWVAYEDFLLSSQIINYSYSWGTGKTMHASIDFDLGNKMIFLEAYGRHIIDQVHKEEDGTILIHFYPSSGNGPFIIRDLRIKFINNNKAYISSKSDIGQRKEVFSPDEPWIWYRLSGPGY